MMELECALAQMCQGKENVARLAEKVGVSKTELQRVFYNYIRQRPLDPDVWQKDVELCWPFIT